MPIKTELTHIIGTRIPYSFRLTQNAVDLDLSLLSSFRFKGQSDAGRVIDIDLTGSIGPGATVVALRLSELVLENLDKSVAGRFHVEFATGTIKASRKIGITVRL